MVAQRVAMKLRNELPNITGTIKNVTNNQVYVNVGKNKGIKKGMRFVIIETSAIKDELSGEILDQDITVIGEAKITKVMKNLSKAIVKNKNPLKKIEALHQVKTR